MKIGNTDLNKSVNERNTNSSLAVVTDGPMSGAERKELQDYRDKDLLNNSASKDNAELESISKANDLDGLWDLPFKVESKTDNNINADKSFNIESDGLKIWKRIDSIASNTAIISNLAGGFMGLMNMPEIAKTRIAKFVDLVTNFSFIPYGLDGMRKAFFENKNPYMFLGFLLELSMVWMSDLKNKYLVRGAATGTDQIWVATKHKLMDKDKERFKDGKFRTWSDGFIETPKACFEMIKDIVTNPKVLTSIDKEKGTKGYFALLSSLGSITSTIGYFLTRNEKIFGTMRDISGSLFDWEMLLDKNPKAKFSGICFIAESVLDFTARFIEDNSTRLFVNMLSHASGRQALQLYKASNDSVSQEKRNQDKQQSDVSALHVLAA